MKRISILAGFLLVTTLLTSVALAQQPVSDDNVNAVAKKLYCPVCENTPLDVCPTQVCKDWRKLIRQQLSEGWKEKQILDYFSTNYGPQVLVQPPAQGFTTLIWILPLAGLAGGGIFLWRLLRRWHDRGRLTETHQDSVREQVTVGEKTEPQGVSAEMLARIEREVEARF